MLQVFNLSQVTSALVLISGRQSAQVFVAFSVPAMVLATRWCDEQTERMWNRESGPALNCMSTCLLILAMRPLATAAVYFSDKQCRAELCDARTLGCKFWRRLRGFGAWLLGCASKGRGLRFVRQRRHDFFLYSSSFFLLFLEPMHTRFSALCHPTRACAMLSFVTLLSSHACLDADWCL